MYILLTTLTIMLSLFQYVKGQPIWSVDDVILQKNGSKTEQKIQLKSR